MVKDNFRSPFNRPRRRIPFVKLRVLRSTNCFYFAGAAEWPFRVSTLPPIVLIRPRLYRILIWLSVWLGSFARFYCFAGVGLYIVCKTGFEAQMTS